MYIPSSVFQMLQWFLKIYFFYPYNVQKGMSVLFETLTFVSNKLIYTLQTTNKVLYEKSVRD